MTEPDASRTITQGQSTYDKADQSAAARRSQARTDQQYDELSPAPEQSVIDAEADYGKAGGQHSGYGSSGQGQYGDGGFIQGGYGQSGYGQDYGQADPGGEDAASKPEKTGRG